MHISRNDSIDSFVTACSEPLPDIEDDGLGCPGSAQLRTETNFPDHAIADGNEVDENEWFQICHRYGSQRFMSV